MSESPQTQLLPHDLDAEKAILGGILVEQTHLFAALEIIQPNDLYLAAHRKILQTMQSMQSREIGIDPLSLKAELQRTGQLEACGGIPYLVTLTDGIARALNVRHYAELVKEASVRRQVITLAHESITTASQGERSCEEIIESLQMQLLKLSTSWQQRKGWIKAGELVHQAYQQIEEIANRKRDVVGLDTGFASLNRMTQGFQPGQLIIIAGRPGHGKSSIATNIITHGILKHGWRVGLFTIEMSAVEIMKRALYAEAEVDSYRAGSGYLSKYDWRKLTDAAGRLAATKLSVDESGGLTIAELRSKAQALAIEGGVDLIVIDYLQLMKSGKKHENRVSELSEITRELKILAKDLNIPVIALSQLSRAIEGQRDRRPILSDLRESGSIEQDADLVLFIWREELRSQKPEDIGKAELIIGKQRNGPTGEIMLSFMPKWTKFADAAPQQELPECN